MIKIASWVGFERFLNSVRTVNRKAYLAYCTGVRSLDALGSPRKNEFVYTPPFACSTIIAYFSLPYASVEHRFFGNCAAA